MKVGVKFGFRPKTQPSKSARIPARLSGPSKCPAVARFLVPTHVPPAISLPVPSACSNAAPATRLLVVPDRRRLQQAQAAVDADLDFRTSTSRPPSGAAINNSQDTLASLAADTGGKASLDANDLSLGLVHAQQAYRSYYVLCFSTSNTSLTTA